MSKDGKFNISLVKRTVQSFALISIVALIISRFFSFSAILNSVSTYHLLHRLATFNSRCDPSIAKTIFSDVQFNVDYANPFNVTRLLLFLVLCVTFVVPFCL